MKKIFSSIIKFAIHKAKQSKFIQNLFEAPFDLQKFQIIAEFKDSNGNIFPVLQGLRSKIKPGWEGMFTKKTEMPSAETINHFKTNGMIEAQRIIPIITSYGKKLENSSILEIGCHSGACTYALAELGAQSIVGSEFTGYKVTSVDQNNTSEKKLEEVDDELKYFRANIANAYTKTSSVSFVDDDICNSTLPKSSFDIICSWDVLEHIHNPQLAFKAIASLLKDNGITIHDYNPFFCLNGGHSPCTLDFLWGHVRLNSADFSRYLDEVRPNEKEMGLSFYNKGLNRMTIADIQEHMKSAGLEVVSLIPFAKEQHLRMVNSDILNQVTAIYPTATMLDLISPRVLVVGRKIM
jgi:2-polyprenyl-3-methyl-5-hydroxy-6-metoxy-1,4-benzoquinol methylase